MSDKTLTADKVRELLEAATPGPWCTDDRYPGNAYCDDAAGTVVAKAGPFDSALVKYDHDANAALIAAAPDIATAYLAAVEERDALAARVAELERANDLLIAGRECSACGHWVTGSHAEVPDAD